MLCIFFGVLTVLFFGVGIVCVILFGYVVCLIERDMDYLVANCPFS